MNSSFVVGEWLVIPALNRIERDGEVVDVQPRLMAVLEELARVPGVVVTRDDLHRSIWRDVTVSEDALNRCITQLRRILDDDPRSPRFIETISKRGYRLIAPVSRNTPPEIETATPIDVDLVIERAALLGYIASATRRDGSFLDARTGVIIVNGHLLLIDGSGAAGALKLRTRSYWAAAPLWLTPLVFVIAFLLLYGHGLNAGAGIALVLLITAVACLAGVGVREKTLARARAALRTFVSSVSAGPSRNRGARP
jgi:DNA-binding winged helix-turn-helix (wHTH) protein